MIDALIEKYGRRLYGLYRSLYKNLSEADELYQETWLRVCQKIELYNPSFEFEAWLTRMCVNIYRNKLRKKKLSIIFDYFDSQETKDAVIEKAASFDRDNP